MRLLPKARTENLIEQNLDRETLLYDLITNKAFNLNETSSAVYRACDGKCSFEDLKRRHQFTDDFIYLALDELKRNNLLAETYQSPFTNTSRREVIKKVGLATMFALPIITGLVAPKAINAASRGQGNAPSGVGNVCQFTGECSSGLECNGVHGRCCVPGINKPFLLTPGQTYVADGSDVVIRGNAVPSEDTDFCPNQVGCCAGGRATGDCTYSTVSGAEPNPVIDSYFVYCTCSCPS